MDLTTSSYDYTYPTTTASDGVVAAILAAMAAVWLVVLVLVVFLLICMWRIFVKAGKPGWAALIPVYNTYVLMEIIGKPWWWLFGLFLGVIPVVGYILTLAFSLIISLELARKFGKSTAFGVVGLWLFSIVGFPMLAFGSAKYDASAAPVVTFLSGDTGKPSKPSSDAPAE